MNLDLFTFLVAVLYVYKMSFHRWCCSNISLHCLSLVLFLISNLLCFLSFSPFFSLYLSFLRSGGHHERAASRLPPPWAVGRRLIRCRSRSFSFISSRFSYSMLDVFTLKFSCFLSFLVYVLWSDVSYWPVFRFTLFSHGTTVARTICWPWTWVTVFLSSRISIWLFFLIQVVTFSILLLILSISVINSCCKVVFLYVPYQDLLKVCFCCLLFLCPTSW